MAGSYFFPLDTMGQLIAFVQGMCPEVKLVPRQRVDRDTYCFPVYGVCAWCHTPRDDYHTICPASMEEYVRSESETRVHYSLSITQPGVKTIHWILVIPFPFRWSDQGIIQIGYHPIDPSGSWQSVGDMWTESSRSNGEIATEQKERACYIGQLQYNHLNGCFRLVYGPGGPHVLLEWDTRMSSLIKEAVYSEVQLHTRDPVAFWKSHGLKINSDAK